MRWELWICALLLPGFAIGCSDAKTSPSQMTKQSPNIRIIVTSQPLLQMTTTLVGEWTEPSLIIPEGQSSPDWSPTAEDAREMQKAGILFISGAGYEPWRDRVSLPRSRVRDTAAGYYEQFIRIPDALTHQHGPAGSHSHPGTVWATWLDPDLCAAQLHQVGLHCVRLMPDRKQAIETAEAKLSAELNALNGTINSIKATSDGRELVVYSDTPNYLYLTRRLGWKLQYLHWHSSGLLSDAEKAELSNLLKPANEGAASDNKQRLFLLDARQSADTEAFVGESGASVIRLDLCEERSGESEPLADRLRQNLQRISNALASE